MLKILIIAGALVAGYVMYLGLQPQIPEQMGFLKLGGTAAGPTAVVATSPAEQRAPVVAGDGWSPASMEGGALALKHSMSADIRVNVQGQVLRYQAPVLYAVCLQGQVRVELDSRAALAQAAVVVNGHPQIMQKLDAGSSYVLPDPQPLLESAARGTALTLKLVYRDAGSQTAALPAVAMNGLASLLPQIGCAA